MLLATCRPPGTAIIGQQQVHARPGEHFRDAEADPGYCASSKGGLSIQIQQVSLKSLSRHRCNQMMCPVPRNCRRRAEFAARSAAVLASALTQAVDRIVGQERRERHTLKLAIQTHAKVQKSCCYTPGRWPLWVDTCLARCDCECPPVTLYVQSRHSAFGQLWSFDSARPGVREGFLGQTTNDRVSMYSGHSGKGLVWGGTTS
jgi:hypothetical protein